MSTSNFTIEQTSIQRAALSLADQPILLFDSDLALSDFNRQAIDVFPDIHRGCDWAKLFPESSVLIRAWLKEVSISGKGSIFQFESEMEGYRNHHLTWKASAAIEDGKFRGFCLVGTDSTQRDQLESDLKKSLRLIQDQKMALDESSIVAITDHRGVIQYVNDTFCRISGYEREELLGKTHAVLKSSFHPPDFFRNLWSTISRGKVWKGEIKNKTKDGTFYWVDTTIVPFLSEAGRPYQFVAIRNDITEKKMMQEKLEKERLRTLYAEKMASLGELAAGIAHELGNPAASINAWLDVIESQNERSTLDVDLFIKMIPKVRHEASRIRDIIRSMLTYARDGSRDPFQGENPLLILNQVNDYCSYKIRKAGIEVRMNVPNPYLSFECRITEISQLVVNLILNACDAVQNLDERWVELSVLDRDDFVEFRVTDSGHGIPADLVENIFKPFVTTKAVERGTGLGLSIAKSIVENHKGQIFLDSSSPNTCFVVNLPKRHSKEY